MKGRLTSSKKKSGGDAQLQVSPEAGPELKEALEVCEAGLAVQVGVPVALRASLLGVWVQCKQLLQQPIPSKTFGVEQRVSCIATYISDVCTALQCVGCPHVTWVNGCMVWVSGCMGEWVHGVGEWVHG